MRAYLLSGLCLLTLLAGCKRGSDVHTSAVASSAAAASLRQDQAGAAEQQAALLRVSTTDLETSVPAEAQTRLPLLKDALAKLVDDALSREPVTASPNDVQKSIVALLPRGKAPSDAERTAQGNETGAASKPHQADYGSNLKAQVQQRDGLLLVDLSVGISCGEDNLLLAYSKASGEWKRVLRWQAAPYQQVSGAFGDLFQAEVLKPTRNGHPVLLVVHGTPWCTSTVSSFGMDAFELDPSRANETPFWHGEHDYRRADDTPRLAFRLKLTADGFEVRASVSDSVGDEVNRVGLVRYALINGTVQRMLPIGMNSRESVSEWLEMPREEAALFLDTPADAGAWQMWDALTYRNKTDKQAEARPMLSYGDVRACNDPGQYQVAIATAVYSRDKEAMRRAKATSFACGKRGRAIAL